MVRDYTEIHHAKSPVVEPGESDHRLTSSGEPSSPTATPESHILVHR